MNDRARVRRSGRRGARPAMTLLEVVISITLMAMLLAALLGFVWESAAIREQAGARSDRTQIARQVLGTLSAELRGCLGSDQVGFPVEDRLVGDRRSITFLTTGLPADSQFIEYKANERLPPAQHDLRLVTYRLWLDTENKTPEGDPLCGGLLRVEKKTLNQFLVEEDDPLDVRTDLWSHEIGYIEFRYFDGVEWDTKWDVTEGNSLPQLIQITIGFKSITQKEYDDSDLKDYPIHDYPLGDDQTHIDRYSTIVRIPAADKFYGSRVQHAGKKMADQFGIEGAGAGGLP
jgi:type II secretory pathway pseudopilin PulG